MLNSWRSLFNVSNKKACISAGFLFWWSVADYLTPLQFIVFQCLQPLKNLSSNKLETILYLYRLSGSCFQLSKTMQNYYFPSNYSCRTQKKLYSPELYMCKHFWTIQHYLYGFIKIDICHTSIVSV